VSEPHAGEAACVTGQPTCVGDGAVARVELVGKPGCHLCDEARDVIARVCAELGVAWQERSILDDPGLADRYWELIPVTLVDGRFLAQWHVDERQLRVALSGDALGAGDH
jgi:hypothetical protein